jgi:hypothetical protein
MRRVEEVFMKRKWKVLCLFVTMLGLLAACNFPLSSGQSEDAVATSVAQTVAAVDAQTQPTVTAIVLQPTSTVSSLPTITPQITSTSISTVPTSTPKPCNQAWMVSESPLDDASYSAGATFTKTWNLNNTGTCTWTGNYRTIYYSGDSISGAGTKYLNSTVAPGEKVDIVYTFKAPSTAGTYKTLFKLQDDEGVSFAQFWVQFKVKSTSPTSTPSTFAVTNVNFSSSDAVKTDTCPQTFDYQAFITANKAGTLTYHFVCSDGSTSTPQSITFSGAGAKTVSGNWDLDTTGDYWVKLYIDEPNHQLFGQLDLSLTCTPAFAVTGVDFSSPASPYDGGSCSTLSIDYQIDISTNGAGTVTYLITFKDSTTTGGSLPFSSAGTQSVTGTWNIDPPVAGDYWFNIYIDNPNHQLFGPHNFTVTCTP